MSSVISFVESSKPKQVAAALDYTNEKIHKINHSFHKHTGIHPRKGKLLLEESLISQLMFTSINSFFGKPKAKQIISRMLLLSSPVTSDRLNSPGMEIEFSEWDFWGLRLLVFKYPNFLIHALFMNYHISYNSQGSGQSPTK